jgi:Cupin superfamily protein
VNDSVSAVSQSIGRVRSQKHGCEAFDGGILDFVYAHIGEDCKVDAAHLLDPAALPTAGHVTEILGNPLLRAQVVRIVADGVSQPVTGLSKRADYNSKIVTDSLDSLTLRRAFAAGATIIIEDTGRWHPPVAAICNSLFNARWLYANGCYYITRSGKRGLPFHADEETTFVFQLAGSKVWHVADYAAQRPGAAEVSHDARVVEFVLCPGDAACIPPMYPHRTEAVGGGDSIHLTIGVRRFKVKDFLKDLAERGMWRVPAFETEIDSIASSRDALLEAVQNSPTEIWERQLAISSIRVASGMADRGFELVWPEGDQGGRGSPGGAAHDLVWSVESTGRSLVYYSGRFAVMDNFGLTALCEAVALRNSRACTWQELLAEGGVPSAVRKFLTSAGWDLEGAGHA